MRKLTNSELNRLDIEQFKKAEKTPLIVILDNVRSLNNIGSVFRTCDAFLIEKIYLCGITATPPNKEIHKTALGATDSVAWEYVENTLSVVEKLKEQERELAKLHGNQQEIGWGSQIRSYVFHPYTMVKDHRTGEEKGNVQAVMDGDIDSFITAYLKSEAQKRVNHE